MSLQKAIELILNLNEEAYLASAVVDIDNNPFAKLTLEVPEDLINARFGQIIPTKDIKDILTRLQFGVEYKKKIFTISVPSFRATKDISIPEDIVEEVARIYGYDNLTPSLPQVTLRQPILDVEHDTAKSVRFYLALSQGYNEVYTYPFTDMFWVEKLGLKASQHLKMTNTLTQDLAYLNLSLLKNKDAYYLVNVVRNVVEQKGFRIDAFSITPGEVEAETEEVAETSQTVNNKFGLTNIPVELTLLGPKSSYVDVVKALERTLPILSISNFEVKNVGEVAQIKLEVETYFVADKFESNLDKLTLADLTLTQDEMSLVKTLSEYDKTAGMVIDSGLIKSGEFKNYDRENPFEL